MVAPTVQEKTGTMAMMGLNREHEGAKTAPALSLGRRRTGIAVKKVRPKLSARPVVRPAQRPAMHTRTGSSLKPVAEAIADGLGLLPPCAQDPSAWRSEDQFIAVDSGLLRHDIRHVGQPVRALISFDAHGIRELARDRVRQEFPDYDNLDGDARRELWRKVLRLSKRVRTERVREILAELESHGIYLEPESITVHRVSSTFSLSLTFNQLLAMRRLQQMGYTKIRRIGVQGLA